jgi:prolyl oligopeptidase
VRPDEAPLREVSCPLRYCVQRIFGLTIWLAVGVGAAAQAIHGREGITLPPPPAVEAIPVADDYFGTKIPDSYRWLEDANSPETQAFIDAQNAYTARYLKQARIRSQVVDDLDAFENVSVASIPLQRASSYFFSKRLAGEQQSSIYVRRGGAAMAGKAPGVTSRDERLIDPAALSREANISVTLEDVSRDGTLLAYSVRQGGVDETTVHVFNVKTGKTLEDELPAARYLCVSFAPDGASLYYSRNNKEGTLLYQHVLGTRNSRDTLIFGREFRGELLTGDDRFSGVVTDDGRYLVVTIGRGTPARHVDIVFRDLTKPGSPFEILVWGLDSRFNAIYVHGAWYVKTDYQAPKGRILKADPGIMPDVWKTIVPEGPDAISDWSIVGGKIYVNRLKDAKTETAVYSPEGTPAGKIDSDGIGSSSAVMGRTADRYGFFSFESFFVPPTIYRLDTATGKREVFFQPKIASDAGFDSDQYELEQVFFKSKDGTQIPMFIADKKGLKRDGTERLLMTAYGGFSVKMEPYWSPATAWWLEQGGWFAVPNLRGGGEYGESWHEQGMLEKKQNVFDDFFAAAEYLIANKYTSPRGLAIEGTSNGGLLMGAAITQRPELFSAVLCDNPLLDMLRFQKFRMGSYWTTEYGSAEKPKQFFYLLKYSPYHNVKRGTAYPAVLFFSSGESDAHPDPFHARKMTALLQSASSSGRPILLHSSLDGGHSAGGGVDPAIQDDADRLTFLWTETAQPATSK